MIKYLKEQFVPFFIALAYVGIGTLSVCSILPDDRFYNYRFKKDCVYVNRLIINCLFAFSLFAPLTIIPNNTSSNG